MGGLPSLPMGGALDRCVDYPLDQQVDYLVDLQVDHSSPERGIPHQSGKYLTAGEKLFLPEDITTPHLSGKRLGPHPLYKSFPSYTHHAMDQISTQKYHLSTSPYTPHTTLDLPQVRISPISTDLWTTSLPTCGLPLYRPMDYPSAQWWTTSPPSIKLIPQTLIYLPTSWFTGGPPLDRPMDHPSTQWWTTPRPSIAPLLI